MARRAAPQASSTTLFVGAGASASWSATARKNLSRQRGGTARALVCTMVTCSGVSALAAAFTVPLSSVVFLRACIRAQYGAKRRLREVIVEVGRAGLPGALRRVFEAATDRPPELSAKSCVHSLELLARPRALSLVAGLGRARFCFFKTISSPAHLALVAHPRDH